MGDRETPEMAADTEEEMSSAEQSVLYDEVENDSNFAIGNEHGSFGVHGGYVVPSLVRLSRPQEPGRRQYWSKQSAASA